MIVKLSCKCHLLWALDSDCRHSSLEAIEDGSLRSQDDRVQLHFIALPFSRIWQRDPCCRILALYLSSYLVCATYPISNIVVCYRADHVL